MFNLLQSANDDQTAIGACVLVLAGAAFFVFASFHLGPAGQKLRTRDRKRAELESTTDSTTTESTTEVAPRRDRAA